jgi:hypothetical protein
MQKIVNAPRQLETVQQHGHSAGHLLHIEGRLTWQPTRDHPDETIETACA